jgi:wobble nucleotide-excising tRNase
LPQYKGKVARRIRNKPTRTYDTRANLKKKMDQIEQENQELGEEMTSMMEEMERLTAMMASILATQAQVPVPQLANTSAAQPTPAVLTSTH